MNALTDTVLRFGTWLTQVTPSPSPSPSGFGAFTGDEDSITPGWVGFALTFLVAIAVVFLLIDMNRRIRRVRYRDEIRAKLAAEQGEQPEG